MALRPYLPLLPFPVWLGFRATAPPRLAAVETAAGTLLLLGAIAVMSAAPRRRTGKPRLLRAVVASAFILFSLVASGNLAVSLQPISRLTGIYANGWSLLSPALSSRTDCSSTSHWSVWSPSRSSAPSSALRFRS